MTVYPGEAMGGIPPEPSSTVARDYPLQTFCFKQGWKAFFFKKENANPYIKGSDGFWASYEEGFESARGSKAPKTPKLGPVWSENYDEIMQAQEAFEKVK